MTKTRSMTSLQNHVPRSFDFLSLSFNSSDESTTSTPVSLKWKIIAPLTMCARKTKPSSSGTLSFKYMHQFWGFDHRNRYERFLSRPTVPGIMANLNQLDDSNYPIIPFLKAQKHSLLFTLYRLEVFEDVVRLFYANIRVSSDTGEL